MAKFSRFVQEAAQRGLIRVTKLENGQMEVDVAGDGRRSRRVGIRRRDAAPRPTLERGGESAEESAARRRPSWSRRPRTRPRARAARARRRRVGGAGRRRGALLAVARSAGQRAAARLAPAARAAAEPEMAGERLTRDEALSLLRRAVPSSLTSEDAAGARERRSPQGARAPGPRQRDARRALLPAHSSRRARRRRDRSPQARR